MRHAPFVPELNWKGHCGTLWHNLTKTHSVLRKQSKLHSDPHLSDRGELPFNFPSTCRNSCCTIVCVRDKLWSQSFHIPKKEIVTYWHCAPRHHVKDVCLCELVPRIIGLNMRLLSINPAANGASAVPGIGWFNYRQGTARGGGILMS